MRFLSALRCSVCDVDRAAARGVEKGFLTYILQDPHLAHDAVDLRIVLALELVEHCVAVLTPFIWSRGPEAPSAAAAAAVYAQMCAVPVGRAAAAWIAVAITPARARCDAPPAVGAGARVALEQCGA